MSLTTVVSLLLQATQTKTADLSQPMDSAQISGNFSWASGTGANQADLVFHDTRTLALSTAEDLDLAGGGLTDQFGTALAFAKVKALLIKSAAANGGNLEVGGDTASVPLFGAAADFIIVKPGGYLFLVAPAAAGYAVTPTSADIIQIANADGAASATYDIVIIGTSA